MSICKFMDLSTGHVSKETAQWLRDEEGIVSWKAFMKGMHGHTVDHEVTSEEELLPQLFQEEFV